MGMNFKNVAIIVLFKKSIYNLYILRGFRKLVTVSFTVKNTSKLINQQFKNWVKIVNWQKKVSYYFFIVKNTHT